MSEFRSQAEREVILAHDDEMFIRGAFPEGTKIAKAHYFDNYNLPCPILLTLEIPGYASREVVFKRSRDVVDHHEPEILQILHKEGLPVPAVLKSGTDSGNDARKLTLMEFVKGQSLQRFSSSSEDNLRKSGRILVDGITTLHQLSTHVAERLGAFAPRYTLNDYLQSVEDQQTAWQGSALFADAVTFLRKNLPDEPLVFTNGDYQPGNFLTDGSRVVSYLDFESARFEDRLFGFAKYMIYDLAPLNRTGVVRDFLDNAGATAIDFAPRLALGCLMTLQKSLQPQGGDPETSAYRQRIIDILNASIREPEAAMEIGRGGLYPAALAFSVLDNSKNQPILPR